MNVLKPIKLNKDKDKFTATYIHPEDAIHLALYSIESNRSRLKIVRELIVDFLGTIPSQKKLIKSISQNIIKNWEETQINNNNKNGWRTIDQLCNRFKEYENKLKATLIKKKIPRNIIEEIIDIVEGNNKG